MLLKEKDVQMLGHFRDNARTSLTKLSRKTRIPVSTIFDKLKELERNEIITKHTTLLNFKNMGYDIRIQMLITANKNSREEIQEFLIKHMKTNTVYRINNGYDFLIEAIFKDMADLDVFQKELEDMGIEDKKEFFIMEDMKREAFMTFKKNIGTKD